MSTKKDLTFFEAAAIITGYGVGGGIMTVPYLTSGCGLVPMLLLLVLGYGISVLMHLMIAEVLLRDGGDGQMVELFRKYLLKDRPALLTWLVFILIVLAFIASLSAYIAGGGRIIVELLSVPLVAGQLIFYSIAAGVIMFGLKALGLSEKFAVTGIMIITAAFIFGSFRVPFTLELSAGGDAKALLSLFGMLMFSFFAIFSVPQVSAGLSWNRKLIPRAILTGIGINAVIIIAIVVMTLGVSTEVDRIAMISLGRALGPWANIGGSLFILIAMLTSYWSVSFALLTVVEERLRCGARLSWLAATLPGLLIVLLTSADFLDFISLAGGAIALLVALMIVPLYNSARRNGPVLKPEWHLGPFGKAGFQALVAAGFLAMAAGSLI